MSLGRLALRILNDDTVRRVMGSSSSAMQPVPANRSRVWAWGRSKCTASENRAHVDREVTRNGGSTTLGSWSRRFAKSSRRSWAEQAYPKLIHDNKLDNGGHFAAWEQPQLLSQEVRDGVRSLR